MPRRDLGILALIGGVALTLAIASYQYSVSVTNEIRNSAISDIHSNTELRAHSLLNTLESKLEAMNNNLRVLSDRSILYDSARVESAKGILSNAQDATNDLTEFYMWIDEDGRMVWFTGITPELSGQYRDVDLSQREYFTEARDTRSVYYSTVVLSNDNVPRLYASHPIFDSDGQFKGIVAAGISLEMLGSYLESQISPTFESSIGMLDRDGTVLYSDNLSIIGMNIFDDPFQSRLPEETKGLFNEFLVRSLSGGSGVEDLSIQGNSGTLAYNTVNIEGKDVGVLYVVTQHTFAENVLFLIDQQRNFSTFIILAIGVIAVVMGIWVLSWNKQLNAVVKRKTRDLQEALTSLQIANERLLAQEKMQQEFINVAAHELRTPVQPLLGIAEQLEGELRDGVDAIKIEKPEIEMFARNAKRLTRLASDILEVSRIESNTIKLQKEHVDLKEKILKVIEDTKSFIDDGQDLELVFDDAAVQEPVVVEADKARLFEVLSNLIRNAIKFTKKGVITVRLEKQDGHVSISIKDTGEGIDPEIMPKLFTKFTTNSDQGTGLGLFISKNILEAHGGKIWAENNPGGRGATFTFTLPLKEDAKRAIPNEREKD